MIEKNSSPKVKGLIVTSTFFIFCALSFQNVWAGVSPVAGGGKTSIKAKPVLVAANPLQVPATVAFDGIPKAARLERPIRIVVKAKIKNFNPGQHDIAVYVFDQQGNILAWRKNLRPNPTTHLLNVTFNAFRNIKNAFSVQIVIGDKRRNQTLAEVKIPIIKPPLVQG